MTISKSVSQLKTLFSDEVELAEKISKNKSLRYFFNNGGCGQLSKLLYKHFVKRKGKVCKILCLMDHNYCYYPDFYKTCTVDEFLENYADDGIDHVALIVDDKIYDATGVRDYNDNYSHDLNKRDSYNYKEIPLENAKKSARIFREIITRHIYGDQKESEIAQRILDEVSL